MSDLPSPWLAGRWPWYGLPPVDDTAPPGVQITARVRPRAKHLAEYRRRLLPWLDAAAARLEEVIRDG
jgi:hypothetical protein